MYNLNLVAEEIYKSVVSDNLFFNHRNIVVVGDNASGKTTLLQVILQLAIDNNSDKIYFIDALNRVVSGSAVKKQDSGLRYENYNVQDILRERSSKSFFSKEDIFVSGTTGSQVTYAELAGNIEDYERLFNQFFTCKLKIDSSIGKKSLISGTDVIWVNDVDINNLSSSQAAKIRLIMEINYAFKSNCKLVIIDEFDDHFDANNLVSFIDRIKEIYPEIRFLFVIHSFDVLVQLSGMDAIIYNNVETSPIDISIVDCDDLTEIGQISRIRSKYISNKGEDEKFLANCVVSCVKKGGISEEQKSTLKALDRNSLNMRNRVIFDYVMKF